MRRAVFSRNDGTCKNLHIGQRDLLIKRCHDVHEAARRIGKRQKLSMDIRLSFVFFPLFCLTITLLL
jgi:hypothetical protein